MRSGFPSLALRVQEVLKHNPPWGQPVLLQGQTRKFVEGHLA
ncbi:hypothetical protein ACWGS9_34800 [Bradyrhizobium sp. Arg314]